MDCQLQSTCSIDSDFPDNSKVLLTKFSVKNMTTTDMAITLNHMSSEITKRELTDDTLVALMFFYVSRLIALCRHATPPSWYSPLSGFFSVARPDIDILEYVRRLVHYSNCSRSAFIAAIVYLERLRTDFPLLALNDLNMHRLLISALTIGASTLDDSTNSLAYFARVGGVSDAKELGKLQLTMLKLLKFRTFVYPEEYIITVLQLSHHRLPVIDNGVLIKARSFPVFNPIIAKKLDVKNLRAAARLSAPICDLECKSGDAENDLNSGYSFERPSTRFEVLPLVLPRNREDAIEFRSEEVKYTSNPSIDPSGICRSQTATGCPCIQQYFIF